MPDAADLLARWCAVLWRNKSAFHPIAYEHPVIVFGMMCLGPSGLASVQRGVNDQVAVPR